MFPCSQNLQEGLLVNENSNDGNPFNPVDRINDFGNSVDPDETGHNEPWHQDVHCLPIFINFVRHTPVCYKRPSQFE